ncbi:ParA family protein [Oscillatoria sp. CS-180]|uniref:ParA family protein n=1 Tax=Oscillatoria sp. CS-180 TaxID=3021720 RepID=UPI00232FB5A5|nr:ParA family protein [Oscillatoria sp. CS-180]MDB9529075.1 ParA family protein [Oscillatoria sp. CS-180]
MRTIALFNQAGGQAKTTLTLNLGYHLAEKGHRVLLIDLDGQASLTKQSGVHPRELKTTIYHTLMDSKPMPILKDIHGMDWVPANGDLYGLDLKLAGKHKPGLKLRTALQNASQEYDFVLIDCPPNLGMASANALIAASHVLIPIETAEKGLEGIEELLATINYAVKMGNRSIRSAGIIPTKYDVRESICKEYYKKIETYFGKAMKIHPIIPSRTDFKHAWAARVPLVKCNPSSDVIPLFKEVVESLETL